MKRFFNKPPVVFLLLVIVNFGALHGKPPALEQLGNSCYMNALLQNLFNLTEVTKFLQSKKQGNNPEIIKNYIGLIEGLIAKDFDEKAFKMYLSNFYREVQLLIKHNDFMRWSEQELIVFKQDDEGWKEKLLARLADKIAKTKNVEKNFLKQLSAKITSDNPVSVFDVIKDRASLGVAFYNSLPESCMQQDLAEPFTKLITIFAEQWKEEIERLLYFTSASVVRCTQTTYESKGRDTSDSYLNLPLVDPFGRAWGDTLEQLLSNAYFSQEKLEGFRPNNGPVDPTCTKEVRLTNSGKYFIIAVKRFDNDNNKIDTSIDIPFELDLYPYFESTAKNRGASVYELIGTANHDGDTGGGHYIAYIKDQSEKDQEWYKCNDAIITQVSDVQAQEAANKAYMLFYKRTDKKSSIPVNVLGQGLAAISEE